VTVFLRQRRHETCTLHSLLQGFKVMDCAWLAPAGFVPGARVTEGDARKRRELLAEFLWWLFDGFLIPLLKVGP
jgi:telomerase reverse transcriptase